MDIVEAKKIADFLNWLPQQMYKFDSPNMYFDIPDISKALHNSEFKCRMPVFGTDPGFGRTTEASLIEFMKELRLLQGCDIDKLTELDDPSKRPDWWQTGSSTDVPGNDDAYLTQLLVVWIPNQPGKLKAVLSALSGHDLLFTSTVHVGEYGLIYLFPRSCLPDEAFTHLNGQVYEILRAKSLTDGLRHRIQESIRCENCVVREVQGLLLKIQDTNDGLLASLKGLYDDIIAVDGNEVNIEVAHVFPHTDGISLCIILLQEHDLHHTIKAFERSRQREIPSSDEASRSCDTNLG